MKKWCFGVGFTVVSLSFADVRDTIDARQETSPLAAAKASVLVYGGIVDPRRDATWPPAVIYNPDAYYELKREFFKDKISIREVTRGKLDKIFELFAPIIPRQWHVSVAKITTFHFDLIDALTLGVQDGNTDIVQAALAKIPYTKAVLQSGKTTDFPLDKPFFIDGNLVIDQFIEDACDSAVSKINACRVTKLAWVGYAASLAIIDVNCLKNFFTAAPLANVASLALSQSFNESFTPAIRSKDLGKIVGDNARVWFARITGTIAVTAAILNHQLQRSYVDKYIKVIDLLVSAPGTTFDHAFAYQQIVQLKNKVTWFGFSDKYAERLQIVLNKL